MDGVLRPCNRRLILEVCAEEQEKDQSGILLPEEYSVKPVYGKAKVLAMAADCTVDVLVGECVVYQNSMLEEINLGSDTHQMILENYILCVA